MGRRRRGDTPEDIQKCLHCTEPECTGQCPNPAHRAYTERVEALARIIYNGGTKAFAVHSLGLTEYQASRYMATRRYQMAIERLQRRDAQALYKN